MLSVILMDLVVLICLNCHKCRDTETKFKYVFLSLAFELSVGKICILRKYFTFLVKGWDSKTRVGSQLAIIRQTLGINLK